DGRWLVTLTEAGILAKIGLNSRRLACGLNLLGTTADGGVHGLPIHVLLRVLLACCDTLKAAVELLLDAEVAASSCVDLAQAGPDGPAAAAVELAPGGARVLRPGPDGVLVHTNHFQAPPPAGADSLVERFPDTLARQRRVAAALAAAGPGDGVAGLLDVLRSHDDGALSVCCHDLENP